MTALLSAQTVGSKPVGRLPLSCAVVRLEPPALVDWPEVWLSQNEFDTTPALELYPRNPPTINPLPVTRPVEIDSEIVR